MSLMLLGLVIVVALIPVGLAYHEARRLVRPRRCRPVLMPTRFGLTIWEEVAFTTSDQVNLRGWFFPPSAQGTTPDQPGRGATVVLVHGTTGNRSVLLPILAELHAAGYAALTFDLRHHGESGGRASGLGVHEVHDVLAALEFLGTRPEVDPQRIALIGHSMGGAAALRAAVRRPDVQAVVTIAAPASLTENLDAGVRALTGVRLPFLVPLIVGLAEWMAQGRISDLRLTDEARAWQGRPLLLVHGGADRVVGFDNARRLQQAHGGTAPLLEVPGAGHGSVLGRDFRAWYQPSLLAFLNGHLRDMPLPLNFTGSEPSPLDQPAPEPLPEPRRADHQPAFPAQAAGLNP